jgi:ParB family transcriptional regulator, chromosome partitioning protein
MAYVSDTPQVLTLAIADIEVGKRIGLYWPEKAAAYGQLIKAEGQNDPIKVRRKGPRAAQRWTLVVGLHRLRGMEMAGLTDIQAIEVSGAPDELRRIEASENMHRRDFNPLERAMFVKAMADDARARWRAGHDDSQSDQEIGQIKRWQEEALRSRGELGPEEIAEKQAEHSADTMSGLYSWQEEAAASIGFGVRQLRRDLFLHRQLIEPFPELARQFALLPVAEKQSDMLKLAKIDAATPMSFNRERLMAWLVEHPGASLAEALDAVPVTGAEKVKAPAQGQTKFMNNADANLRRLSASSWREWAPSLAITVKPSALVAVRDALNARIEELGDLEDGD